MTLSRLWGTCKLYLVHLDTKKLIETIFYVATTDDSVLLSCKSTLASDREEFSSLCVMWGEIEMWYKVCKCEIIAGCGVRLWSGMRLLEDVGWGLLQDVGWDDCRMWGEIIAGCEVRIWEDVGWDYDLSAVGWDYWRMWGEIIAGCGVGLLEDVRWDYCRMWGEINGGCGVRLLQDVV